MQLLDSHAFIVFVFVVLHVVLFALSGCLPFVLSAIPILPSHLPSTSQLILVYLLFCFKLLKYCLMFFRLQANCSLPSTPLWHRFWLLTQVLANNLIFKTINLSQYINYTYSILIHGISTIKMAQQHRIKWSTDFLNKVLNSFLKSSIIYLLMKSFIY